MRKSKDIYAERGRSLAQRIFMAAAIGACVITVWWLLLAGGAQLVGPCFGTKWPVAQLSRRLCLTTALTIYYIRLLFTQFLFLKRTVGWSEAAMIVPWIFVIYLVSALSACGNPHPFGAAGAGGIILFIFGSWMNTYAEYTRHIWKQCPENHGKLFTVGLFKYSRHPNYFGDLLSFSGICLITGRWYAAAIPLIMLAGFVFANIPMLDNHLRDKYGPEFEQYAAKTRKLIPYVY